MEIGEFKSDDLTILLNKAWTLEKRFENYCRQHNKKFETLFLTSKTSKVYFLKIKII